MLQKYLGDEYTVTQITHEDGRISFNVKRDDFEYNTIRYRAKQAQQVNILEMIGLTVQMKYASWKFNKGLK